MTETRRRGEQLETAILDAGWRVLLDAGYTGFAFEAVAERAQTGKAALYRRWPDKESLLLAVLDHGYLGRRPEVPDTGTLRSDVLAQLRSASNRLGKNAPAVLSAVLGAYFESGQASPAEMRERMLGERSLAMPQILQRAVDRGELASMPPERMVNLPFDLMRHEVFMNLGTVPDATIVDIVDTVFLPALGLGPTVPRHA